MGWVVVVVIIRVDGAAGRHSARREPWVHLESEEESVATDETAGTEAAISHKDVGTAKKYILPHRVAQTTTGTDNARPNRKDKHSYKGY